MEKTLILAKQMESKNEKSRTCHFHIKLQYTMDLAKSNFGKLNSNISTCLMGENLEKHKKERERHLDAIPTLPCIV
jgi:hypothetical protein